MSGSDHHDFGAALRPVSHTVSYRISAVTRRPDSRFTAPPQSAIREPRVTGLFHDGTTGRSRVGMGRRLAKGVAPGAFAARSIARGWPGNTSRHQRRATVRSTDPCGSSPRWTCLSLDRRVRFDTNCQFHQALKSLRVEEVLARNHAQAPMGTVRSDRRGMSAAAP